MEDCQSEEKFCFLKNKLTYPTNNSNINKDFSILVFSKEINIAVLQKYYTVYVMPIEFIR